MDKFFSLQWHITDKCDQKCKHCYIYGNNTKFEMKEMDLETISFALNDFLDFCHRIDMKPYIAITGGDPLLHEKIWDILLLIHSKNVDYGLMGNPFHLSDESVSKLKKLGCISYQMSLDGTKEIHDSIRKKGSFNSTIEKIGLLNKYKIKTSIMVTVSKMNVQCIPNIVPIVVDAGAKVFSFSRYCPNAGDKEKMLSPLEYRKFLCDMWDMYSNYSDSDTKFVMKDHLWKLFLYEKGLLDFNGFDDDIIYDGCHCGITHMTLLPSGDVYACRRCDSMVGHLPDDTFYDIFFGKAMDSYRDYDRFEFCKSCNLFRFCRGCPAVAKCAYGDFYGKDPQCWFSQTN